MNRTNGQRLGDILERIRAARLAEDLLVAAEGKGENEIAQTAYDANLYDLVIIG